MLFNSIEFLIFFPIVFVIFWHILRNHLQLQNAFLLIASYIFYGWWDWRFLLLIIISSFVDFIIGFYLGKTINKSKRKALVTISLIANLGILFFFKYFNFFISSFSDLASSFGLNLHTSTLNIILPVGISFYTFQTLSYTLDIYRNKLTPTKDALAFFTFVAFFPQLVAGPIERAKHMLPQFLKKRTFNYKYASSGAKLVLLGFFKKVVIADNVALLVDTVYNSPESYKGLPLLIATIFFAFQIYCDFSGYSDIAIGTARMLGFELSINFKTPYYSKSIREFWTRWHISLSTWFRDYVYLPLGGSKVTKPRWMTNIFITFTVSGLWHGSNWTFIVWGAFHGVILIIERTTLTFRNKIFSILNQRLTKIFSVFLTFSLVCFGWIFFRANNLSDALYIATNMFSDIHDYGNPVKLATKFRGMGLKLNDLIEPIIFIAVLEFIQLLDRDNSFWEKLGKKPVIIKYLFYYFMLIAIVFWGIKNTAQNFIYYQF